VRASELLPRPGSTKTGRGNAYQAEGKSGGELTPGGQREMSVTLAIVWGQADVKNLRTVPGSVSSDVEGELRPHCEAPNHEKGDGGGVKPLNAFGERRQVRRVLSVITFSIEERTTFTGGRGSRNQRGPYRRPGRGNVRGAVSISRGKMRSGGCLFTPTEGRRSKGSREEIREDQIGGSREASFKLGSSAGILRGKEVLVQGRGRVRTKTQINSQGSSHPGASVSVGFGEGEVRRGADVRGNRKKRLWAGPRRQCLRTSSSGKSGSIH